jgi:MoxR-like ATPase
VNHNDKKTGGPGFELIALPQDPLAHERDRQQARNRLEARRLPPSLHDHKLAARHFRPSPDLLMALNMALNVGAPLLLTGEPGTGKTQTAEFLAWYFEIPIFKYQVKSTASAESLRYDFDAVGYLRWAQSRRESDKADDPSAGEPTTEDAAVSVAATARERSRFLTQGPLWQAYLEPTDAVLLIDEIDKAPRDFPNDLLHELDQHAFEHPFLGREIRPASGRPPIVLVTSNDERRLPDAFLRRCIFHRIELTEDLVRDAVRAHAGEFPNLNEAVQKIALERFWRLRDLAQEKKPTTAELLVWLCILSARGVDANDLREAAWTELPGINALIKDAADLENLR